MERYAVLTGDIVGSSNISGHNRNKLLNELKNIFHDIQYYILDNQNNNFEIFRGDSFQGIVYEPEKALLVGIILRAGLRHKSEKNTINNLWDSRISIGFGTVEYFADQVAESDGPAFWYSGKGLDQMKNQEQRLRITTDQSFINEEFHVECALSDTIIRRWTTQQAEAVYLYFLEKLTQQEIGHRLGTSQRAIGKRLASASIPAIKTFLNRYESIIKNNFRWKLQA